MSDKLIERWKSIKCGPQGYCSEPIADLIADTINLLSPVMPDEIEDLIAEITRLQKQNEIAVKALKKISAAGVITQKQGEFHGTAVSHTPRVAAQALAAIERLTRQEEEG